MKNRLLRKDGIRANLLLGLTLLRIRPLGSWARGSWQRRSELDVELTIAALHPARRGVTSRAKGAALLFRVAGAHAAGGFSELAGAERVEGLERVARRRNLLQTLDGKIEGRQIVRLEDRDLRSAAHPDAQLLEPREIASLHGVDRRFQRDPPRRRELHAVQLLPRA